jgi:hypothetical protein
MHHGALRLRFTPTAIFGDAICGPAGDTGSNKNDMTCSPGSVFDSFVIPIQTAGVPSITRGARLAIRARPNPTSALSNIEYSLTGWSPAHVELLDIAGRTLLNRDFGALGPGRHETSLGAGSVPGAGYYWLRLSQHGRQAKAPLIFVR